MTRSLASFLDAIAERSAYATIAQAGLDSEPLRRHLRDCLVRPPGTPGSFLADPVLEAGFDWERADKTMADLTGVLLRPELIEALHQSDPVNPDELRERYHFPRDRRPYIHQLLAWEILRAPEPRSVLVTSGTGSGKTECFLIPILDELVRERAEHGRLSGVRALMVYPLNALINSQRDRLADWTRPFDGDVRYCLYNGETPEEVRQAVQEHHPERVLSRKLLRREPAPILVTNVTMLEYMLVRSVDAPILERSSGRLRWIVLDEAHTYIGSQAAELSLLLRRVIRAFGVRAEDVRFVATSATIGGSKETRERLRRFLADLAGVSPERVEVIEGERDVPPLPEAADAPLPDASDPALGDPEFAARRLAAAPQFRTLRDHLARRPLALRKASEILFPDSESSVETRAQVLAVVSVAAHARHRGDRLLPARLHLAHRAQPGLFACINSGCQGRTGTPLDDAGWPWGCVFVDATESCPACGSPVFELVGCSECSAPAVVALESDDGRLLPYEPWAESDEFAQDVDPPEDEAEEGAEQTAPTSGRQRMILPAGSAHAEQVLVSRQDARVLDEPQEGAIRVALSAPDRCPACRSRPARGQQDGYRRARFGAPFLLGNVVPQLLDVAPPKASGLPADGRQLLTFTDSRQGTARFAAKLQQDAERNYVRSLIYHAVQAAEGGDADRRETLRRRLDRLKLMKDDPELGPIYEETRRELEELEATIAGLDWGKARDLLAGRPEMRWMRDLWEARDADFASEAKLARMQLFREFLRRPRRQNSAETMGLAALRFAALEQGAESSLPAPFRDSGLGVEDWQAFLDIVLTHFVRANTAVEVDLDTLRWIGLPGRPRRIKAPGREASRSMGELPWPLAGGGGRTPRLVRLLAEGLGLDLERPADRDAVNDCLEAAWEALRPLRASGQPDFQLDLSRARIARVDRAWICPVTGRLLDRVFRGRTPYLPTGSRQVGRRAEPVAMPRLPFPWGERDGTSVATNEVEAWLAEDAAVAAARENGVWTDLHDRIVHRVPYTRIAEHSAQQPSRRLQDYEARFKRGEINVLCCSTTMEMGVDIGGVTTVVMTNVPPAPANYRQRVGRAGRRGEALAVGLTFCPDTPLGWTLFRNPTWPFDHVQQPPSVSLDSPVIVQRHVNALLLSAHLKTLAPAGGEDVHRMRVGWFFGALDGGRPFPEHETPAAGFVAWLEQPLGLPEGVAGDLEALVAYTCLDGAGDLRFHTAEAIQEHQVAWRAEREALAGTLEGLATSDNAARRAVELQLRRLSRSYLLGELATRGFLPGYGFPTDVVSFVNVTASQRMGRDRDEREDNPLAIRNFPSRSLDLAIRDYAPGNDVVVDGLVYRVSGITLNWQRPASESSVREIQALRYAWKCNACGVTDTTSVEPELCSSCASTNLAVMPYLRPAGFAVDIRYQPHTDITRPSYVPPTRPWISARHGAWAALVDPELGRQRVTRTGHVFHHSLGTDGHGYVICLECGRAAAETALRDRNPPLPRELIDHRPLRGAARGGPQRDGVCSGTEKPFGISRHRMLGHDLTTDVFELQLFGLGESVVATSLVVAMREGLARLLSIESDEVGWAAVRARVETGGVAYSLFLYDRASGGAGFASAAGDLLTRVLEHAEAILECRNPGCVRACHGCLLGTDTQHDEQNLDRSVALEHLRRRILPQLHLPRRLRHFGDCSQPEQRPLLEALDTELRRQPGAGLRLWLGGEPERWDPPSFAALGLLELWGGKARPITLLVARAALDRLDPTQKRALARLADRARAGLALVEEMPRAGAGYVLAAVESPTRRRIWAAETPDSCVPDDLWGRGTGPLTSAVDPQWEAPAETSLEIERLLADPRPRMDALRIGRELDGSVAGFGQRFWDHIRSARPDLDAPLMRGRLASAEYDDRYLLSPLAVRLLLETLVSLGRPDDDRPRLRTRTLAALEGRSSPALFEHDWQHQAHRAVVMHQAVAAAGFTPELTFGTRRDLPHERALTLTWSDGSILALSLDQGFGHWRTGRNVLFPFTARPEQQARELLRSTFTVIARSPHPTIVFVGDLQPSTRASGA